MKSVKNVSRYPKAVFFILGNEFCERFSFYGMRALLVLYLIIEHQMSERRVLFIRPLRKRQKRQILKKDKGVLEKLRKKEKNIYRNDDTKKREREIKKE